MATIAINFLVMTIMFVAYIIPISVLAYAETYSYGHDTNNTTPPPPPPPPPPPTPCPPPPGSCQLTGEFCSEYGPYTCCHGLECRIPAVGVGPIGTTLCLPPLATKVINNKDVPLPDVVKQVTAGEPPRTLEKCQKRGNLCHRATYDCCDGLHCTYPPDVVGLGFCLEKGVPVLPEVDYFFNGAQRCQKVTELCNVYGSITCCEEFICHVIKPFVGTGVCIPPL